jgi:glycosyltransferase involved in cell wall biosynthesis
VSIYLKQLFPFLRKAPEWLDNFLNSKPVLKFAARRAGSTRAKGLEDMTISMLMGEHGGQREELERMTDWMMEHYKPDIIHLSNALLLGLARELKEKLKAPVICSLQDEDIWIDVMTPENRQKVWKLMAEKSKHVDRFISVSKYYTGIAKNQMKLPDEKINTIHLGVDPNDYKYKNSVEKERNIGFVSRMCHENGLDILVDAFIELKKNGKNTDVRLVITGGHTGDDIKYLKKIKKKLSANKLDNHVEFHKDFEGEGRQIFFEKVSVISVPVRNGEAFGIYIAEALASGIPVVQPNLGAFPEIITKSGGGIIYKDNNPGSLAKALQILLDDKEKLEELSTIARKSVEMKFNINILAKELIQVYQDTLSN